MDRGYLAIRAVDHAGNIGPVQVRAAPAAAAASLGMVPVAPVSLTGIAILTWLAPRRRRAGRRG
jgi:hypothetical protein